MNGLRIVIKIEIIKVKGTLLINGQSNNTLIIIIKKKKIFW